MALDADRIFALAMPERTADCAARDAILYALCCGAGQGGDLRFVHEDSLRVIPSFGQNLCFDDSWMEATGVDLSKVVHAGLDLRMHRPFKPGASLTVRPRIAGLADKGAGKAGLILFQADLLQGEELVFTSLSNLFVIGGGGFGGDRGEAFEMNRIPEAAPDEVVELGTRPDSPLLFRLLGDLNSLHVLPEAARAAGFERPIMHGANTFGIVCHDVLTRFAGGDPTRMKRFTARFSGPLYPGERLGLSYWREQDGVRFAAICLDRETRVLDGGLAEIS